MARFILSRFLEPEERVLESRGEKKEVYVGDDPDLLQKALEKDYDNQKDPSAYYMLQSRYDGPDGADITKKVFRYGDSGEMHIIQEHIISGIDPRLFSL